MQRGAIILNGISRRKEKFYSEIYPALAAQYAVTVFETTSAGHARILAAHAVKEKFDFILAAGGDGTLNQVLNGMLSVTGYPVPAMGLIPLGSGNDFARTCNLSDNPLGILERIAQNPKPTDIGLVSCMSAEKNPVQRFYINCCSIGMGPDVVRRLENSRRSLGPGATYMLSILKTFFLQKLSVVTCTAGNWTWSGKVRVLAIANARSFGHAVYIAPKAQVDDGLQNIFLAGDFPTLTFILFLIRLKAGKLIRNKKVIYRSADTVTLTSNSNVLLETEGELAGLLPATITTLPGKILFFR